MIYEKTRKTKEAKKPKRKIKRGKATKKKKKKEKRRRDLREERRRIRKNRGFATDRMRMRRRPTKSYPNVRIIIVITESKLLYINSSNEKQM